MRVLVTGSKGFIGSNLVCRLHEAKHDVFEFDTDSSNDELARFVANADWIVHLAGVNRPLSNGEFQDGNVNLTKKLIELVWRTISISFLVRLTFPS